LIIFAATPEIEKMLEIPESYSFARQAADMLSGRTVTDTGDKTKCIKEEQRQKDR